MSQLAIAGLALIGFGLFMLGYALGFRHCKDVATPPFDESTLDDIEMRARRAQQ